MNFAKFLRTPFLTEYLRWLLMKGCLGKDRQTDRQTDRGWLPTDLEREIERDLKNTAADRNSTVLQYPKLMRSSRRDHSINFSDKTYGCLSGLSCRCFFKAMNFSDRFRQCFKLFYSFEKQLFMDFLEFPKKYSRKPV